MLILDEKIKKRLALLSDESLKLSSSVVKTIYGHKTIVDSSGTIYTYDATESWLCTDGSYMLENGQIISLGRMYPGRQHNGALFARYYTLEKDYRISRTMPKWLKHESEVSDLNSGEAVDITIKELEQFDF